ncbi:hypothetical protein C8R43DRAFT_940751 [Mycena crocata]|nr:hypothetical protein C8R43DRAFT_940751 [Mycena crocata]
MSSSEVASAVSSSAAATAAALTVDAAVPPAAAKNSPPVLASPDSDSDSSSEASYTSSGRSAARTASPPTVDTAVAANGTDDSAAPRSPASDTYSYDSESDSSSGSGISAFTAILPVASVLPTGIHLTGPWVAGEIYGVVPLAPLTLVPDNGPEKWYAITKGKYVGCTPSTAVADGAVTCVSHALRSAYPSQAAAVGAFNAALAMNPWAELVKVIRTD